MDCCWIVTTVFIRSTLDYPGTKGLRLTFHALCRPLFFPSFHLQSSLNSILQIFHESRVVYMEDLI